MRHAARYPCWPHGVLAVGRDRRVGAETFLVGSLGRRLVRTKRSRGERKVRMRGTIGRGRHASGVVFVLVLRLQRHAYNLRIESFLVLCTPIRWEAGFSLRAWRPLGLTNLSAPPRSSAVILFKCQKTPVDSISAFSNSSLNLLRSPVFNIFFGLSVSRVSGVFTYSIGGCSRARRGYGVWGYRHIFRGAFPPLMCAPVSALLCPCRLQCRPSMRSCLEEVTILAPFSTPCFLVFAGRAWLGFGLFGIKPSLVVASLHVGDMALEEARDHMQQRAPPHVPTWPSCDGQQLPRYYPSRI